MTWFKKYFLNWPVPVYVLLLAAFPVLYLYAYNIAETKFGEAALPLALSLAGAVVLWALLTLILRNARKSGIAVAIFLLLFFTYGRLYEFLENWGLLVPKHGYLLPAMLFIWAYCVYFIGRTKRDFRITTTVFNVVAVALIAINLINIASYQVRMARLDTGTPGESPAESPANPGEPSTLPDIYFIILDEYAHPDTIKEWCDYDNSEFIDSLADKGFFTASQSKTRTPSSPHCLAQVLNMDYLTDPMSWDEEKKDYIETISGKYPDISPWSDANYQKIAYSMVSDFLRAQGYQYIFFGNWLSSARWDKYMEDNADLYFNYYLSAGTPWVSEFQETLWDTTMLRPFYRYILGSQYEIAYRRQTLSTLEHLKALPEMEGPKFVVAYLMCPHEAFVFGPRGEVVHTINWYNYRDKQYYLGQYIFMNVEIEKMIDALLEKSEIPPIIILQSDHGLRPHHTGIEIGGDEWHKILNAMYLPGIDYDELSDSISPVNTFRLIFNHYFDANYPLLGDD